MEGVKISSPTNNLAEHVMHNNSPQNQEAGITPTSNYEDSPVYGDRTEITQFECKQCGNCCRGNGYVRITPDESKRIARFLNIKVASFYNQYTFRPDGQTDVGTEDNEHWLLDTETRECAFLENNLCKIHPVKPAQCRDFPQHWRPRDFFHYCKGMQN